MDIKFRSDMGVELRDYMGNDASIVKAMLVSTQGRDSLDAEESEGRINFLMKNRHGTPFEHAAMTFYISAPIFVFREFHRHRIGWSYNEESGRYKQLDPVFYIPDKNRALVQQGKPGHYEFVPGDSSQWADMSVTHETVARDAYGHYEYLLQGGIAKEVARMTLPVNIYSSMYATCNPRSLMAFLSLRKKWEHTYRPDLREEDKWPMVDGYIEPKFPSFPMREIEMVAEQMAAIFAELFPLTYKSFLKNGMVAP